MLHVLITGGSSGIGFEMSRHFARNGYQLLWVAKPEDELQKSKLKLENEVAGVSIQTLALDLTKPDACKNVYDWSKNIGTVDVLINNAGFGTHRYTQDQSIQKELDMIRLNVMAVYELTRLFLNDMKDRNAGTIINISSNSSFQPVARMNTYASTKAFVTHFSRGLQEELALQNSKVRILTVCPSAIQDTPFSKDMKNVKTFNGLAYTTAKEVAGDVWKAFQKGKTFQVTGSRMRFLYAIRRFMPYSLQQYLVRKETEIVK